MDKMENTIKTLETILNIMRGLENISVSRVSSLETITEKLKTRYTVIKSSSKIIGIMISNSQK